MIVILTPDEHTDDLHRLISALDAGPAEYGGMGEPDAFAATLHKVLAD